MVSFGTLLILLCHTACRSPKLPLPSVLVLSATVSLDYVDGDTVYTLEVDTTQYRPKASPEAWYWSWHQGSLIKRQGGYQGQLLHGAYSQSLRNGALLQEGSYDWGLPNGEWKTWSANGNLKAIETWKRGIRNGKVYYYRSGRVFQRGSYRNGLKDGSWETLSGDGTWEITEYSQGQEVPKEAENSPSGS